MTLADVDNLAVDKDERPPIPSFDSCVDVANAVANLVQSCWVRQPDHRPSFSNVTASLEEIWKLHGHGSPQIRHATPLRHVGLTPVTSTESSPADEQYETASESMRTEVEELADGMIDISLTSPGPASERGRSMCHVNAINHAEIVKVSTQVTSGILGHQDDTPTPSPTSKWNTDMRNEENYRLIAGSNHAFHNSREFVSG